jgi:hypothetical protein
MRTIIYREPERLSMFNGGIQQIILTLRSETLNDLLPLMLSQSAREGKMKNSCVAL